MINTFSVHCALDLIAQHQQSVAYKMLQEDSLHLFPVFAVNTKYLVYQRIEQDPQMHWMRWSYGDRYTQLIIPTLRCPQLFHRVMVRKVKQRCSRVVVLSIGVVESGDRSRGVVHRLECLVCSPREDARLMLSSYLTFRVTVTVSKRANSTRFLWWTKATTRQPNVNNSVVKTHHTNSNIRFLP